MRSDAAFTSGAADTDATEARPPCRQVACCRAVLLSSLHPFTHAASCMPHAANPHLHPRPFARPRRAVPLRWPPSSRLTRSWGLPSGMPRWQRCTSRIGRRARSWRAGRRSSWGSRLSSSGCRKRLARRADASRLAGRCVRAAPVIPQRMPSANKDCRSCYASEISRAALQPLLSATLLSQRPAQRLPVCQMVHNAPPALISASPPFLPIVEGD